MSFFDPQVNGYAGVDFCSLDLTQDELRRACDSIRADGIAGILATVITDSIDSLTKKLNQMVRYREADPVIAETIRGFHVEGPFISPVAGYVGAHPADKVKPANPDDAARLLDAGEGLVRLVTLAPEFDAGQITTRYLVGQGVTVSAGHCDPDEDTLDAAIDAGLSMVTHLGNGCPVVLPRHDNFIQRVLARADRLWISFIPDGAHVPFFALRNCLRLLDVDRIVFTTDAIMAAGLGSGIYELSGAPVEIDENGVARRPGSENLAGSTIRGHQVVNNLREELMFNDSEIEKVFGANALRAIGLDAASG